MTLSSHLTSDLSTLLGTDDFGVAGAITDGATINGIFDDASEMVNAETGAVETTNPQFICRTADVSSVVIATVITISSTPYSVIGIQPDGTGLTTLILSED